MDPVVLVIGFLMVIILFSVLFAINFLIAKGQDRSRQYEFKKISKEYGLKLDCHDYSFTALIIKDKSYQKLSLTGSIHGHSVLIEDVFTTLNSGQWGPTRIMDGFNHFYNEAQIHWRTEISIDAAKQVLDAYDEQNEMFKVVVPRGARGISATYEQIKTVLNSIS